MPDITRTRTETFARLTDHDHQWQTRPDGCLKCVHCDAAGLRPTDLRLTPTDHEITIDDHGPDGFGTRFQAYCSCGWDGARQWPDDVDQPGFDPHGLSAQEANEAAERDGAEHLAESAPR